MKKHELQMDPFRHGFLRLDRKSGYRYRRDYWRASPSETDDQFVVGESRKACGNSTSQTFNQGNQLWLVRRAAKTIEAINVFCADRRLTVFSFCCLLIIAVAVLDTWLVIKYADSIQQLEQNPLCLFLIQQDPCQLKVFVSGKVIGNLSVLAVLLTLFRFWQKVVMPITLAIAFFQVSLVCYLYVLSDLPHYYLLYWQ